MNNFEREENFAAETQSSENQNYEVKRSKKSNIFAFILCLVIAFAIWIFAVNNDKKLAEQQVPSQTPTASESANIEI